MRRDLEKGNDLSFLQLLSFSSGQAFCYCIVVVNCETRRVQKEDMKVDTVFQPLSIGFMERQHHFQRGVGITTNMDFDNEDTQDVTVNHSDLLILAQQQQVEGSGERNNNSLRKAEIRKSNKPIMEKKRRARINNCLNDLKAILLEAMRKDPARHSKLEKADILELTVRHLQNVQRNQLAIAMATDPTVLHRFKNGFAECLTEVTRYMSKMEGADQGIRQRLTGHLSSCVNGLQQVNPFGVPPQNTTQQPSTHYAHGPVLIGATPAANTHVSFIQQPIPPVLKHTPVNIAENLSLSVHQAQQEPVISQDLNNNTNNRQVHRFATAFSTRLHVSLAPGPTAIGENSMIFVSPPASSSEASTATGGSASDTSSSNLNITSSSGTRSNESDISICTGSEKGTNTSPNSFSLAGAIASSTPIDFSMKEKPSAIRVLKVEPRVLIGDDEHEHNMGDETDASFRGRPRIKRTVLPTKDDMWRPW